MKVEEIINVLEKLNPTLDLSESETVIVDKTRGMEWRLILLPPTVKEVVWSTDDFLVQAENEGGDDWEIIYDVDKFQSALERMIFKHNADEGITWSTVSEYLNKYCRKDD